MSSRRKFLQGAAFGGSVLGLAPVSLLAAMDAADDTALGVKRLRGLIGSPFYLLDDDGNLASIRLEQLRPVGLDDRVEQFQLFFGQATSDRLSEHSYRLHHARLGQISLFLQPINEVHQDWACRSDLCLLR